MIQIVRISLGELLDIFWRYYIMSYQEVYHEQIKSRNFA